MVIGTLIVYCVFFIAGEVLSYIIDKEKNSIRAKVTLFFLILVITSLSGLRSPDVGKDSLGYWGIIVGLDGYKGMETGFRFLIYGLRYICDSYIFVFFMVSFITNALFIIRMWEMRICSPLRFSFPFFYTMIFFGTMSGIRQLLAAAIAFFATRYIYGNRKSLTKYMLFIIIAFCMHRTALAAVIMIIPVLLGRAKDLKWSVYKILFVTLAPIVACCAYWLVITRYAVFLKMDSTDMSIGLMIPFRIILLVLIIIEQYREHNSKSKEGTNIIPLLVFNEMFNLLASGMGYFWHTLSRICWYPAAFSTILYGKMLSSNKSSIRVWCIKAMILTVGLYYFLSIFTDPSNSLVPYDFCVGWTPPEEIYWLE